MSAAGRVSVVVPLYNHARYIAEALRSALAQGPILREVIVLDDGSTDEGPRVAEDLARREPRIAFRSRPNRGAHATINEALAEATGEFVAILNSDDAYLPGRLEALVAALEADPAATLAASRLRFADAAGEPLDNPWYEQAEAHRRGRDPALALVHANFLMTTSNYFFRRGLTDEIGGFAALRYAHDLDFALRALAHGHGLALVERPLLRYRIHGANTISEDHARVRAEWALAAGALLHARRDRPGAPEPDWAAEAALEETLSRHALSRAAHLAAAYLRRHGGGTLATSPLLSDADFLERLRGWV